MEEVKVGSKFGTDYVQQLQESLRVKTAECDRVYKELDRAQVSIGDLQEQLAEARQAFRKSENSVKDLADEIVKRTMTIKARNDECEGYKRELLDLTSHHADLSRSYCKDYKITLKKNRKLKKRLREREEQLENSAARIITLRKMLNLEGE